MVPLMIQVMLFANIERLLHQVFHEVHGQRMFNVFKFELELSGKLQKIGDQPEKVRCIDFRALQRQANDEKKKHRNSLIFGDVEKKAASVDNELSN